MEKERERWFKLTLDRYNGGRMADGRWKMEDGRETLNVGLSNWPRNRQIDILGRDDESGK
jgi:hypothetical protein